MKFILIQINLTKLSIYIKKREYDLYRSFHLYCDTDRNVDSLDGLAQIGGHNNKKKRGHKEKIAHHLNTVGIASPSVWK